MSVGPNKILSRWREHFERVLNVFSSSDQATLDALKNLPLGCEFCELPDHDMYKDEILGNLGTDHDFG